MGSREGWDIWKDEVSESVHVVSRVDAPLLNLHVPNPWHTFGDAPCQCQPRVLHADWVTDWRSIGHKDPIH